MRSIPGGGRALSAHPDPHPKNSSLRSKFFDLPTRGRLSRIPMTKHFIDLSDFDTATLRAMLTEAKQRKDARGDLPRGAPDADAPLKGRVLALIFDKHSTRTRISFDVGMTHLAR